MGKVSKAPKISNSPGLNSPTLSTIRRGSTNSSGGLSTISRRSSTNSMLTDKTSRLDVEIVFVNKLEKRFECPVCAQVVRYPVQFEECGHRVCSSCLPEIIRVEPRCPIDQVKVDKDKIFVDKAFQSETDELAVKCCKHDKGCDWQASLKDLMNHVEQCLYFETTCPEDCGAHFEKRFLEKHNSDDCPLRKISCEFCQLIVQFQEETEHHNVCLKLPVPCPNGCEKEPILREELKMHLDTECTKETVSCPFEDAGCDFKTERDDMKKHVKENPDNHLLMVNASLITFKQALRSQKQLVDSNIDDFVKINARISSLEKLYGSQIIWRIDNYAEKLQEAMDGKTITIYSPPFLTSRHGYKMVISACLYGDGKTRGQYMALFVCICKGDHDPILLWPFCHRVTFTLFDQCEDISSRRNIVYSVKPNTVKQNLSFLRRPTGDRNPSFGASKFAGLKQLASLEFIKDDTMFIKVDVDCADILLL